MGKKERYKEYVIDQLVENTEIRMHKGDTFYIIPMYPSWAFRVNELEGFNVYGAMSYKYYMEKLFGIYDIEDIKTIHEEFLLRLQKMYWEHPWNVY